MSMLQSRNPAMGVFERYGDDQIAQSERRSTTMTIGGTVTATSILLSIVAIVGILTFQNIASGGFMRQFMLPVALFGAFGGIIVSFIIYGKPKIAKFIAPVHAVLEGVFVGAASFMIPYYFLSKGSEGAATGGADSVSTGSMQSLILQAVLATLAIAAGMLAGYATGVIRVGPIFQKIMVTAAIGLAMYVGLLFLLPIFGINLWNGYADTGMMGIGFTVLCVGLASLFLILDFQFVEQGVKSGAPKYMEWVGAWALMVTIVWLYIEVLRLLAKLQSRD